MNSHLPVPRYPGRPFLPCGCWPRLALAVLAGLLVATPGRAVPLPETVPTFTVYADASAAGSVTALAAMLTDANKKAKVDTAASLEDAAKSKSEVLILLLARGAPDAGKEVLASLKNHKVVGIGYGAAELFGQLGLEVNGGACAHRTGDLAPKIDLQDSLLLGKRAGKSLVAFRLTRAAGIDANFAMYIPSRSPQRAVVDVLARWHGDDNYAPIVRQDNFILIGLATPEETWTPEYRQLLQDVAMALHGRKPEPFARARWPTTKPGKDYQAELGKSRDTVELSDRTYYFQFSKPTTFRAQLEQDGSKNVMLLFMGEKREHWTRVDGGAGKPLEISIKITEADIKNMGDGYWSLRVANFDPEHPARCALVFDY